jgi:hypothetical protein
MTTTINKDCEARLGRVLKQMGHQLVKGGRLFDRRDFIQG